MRKNKDIRIAFYDEHKDMLNKELHNMEFLDKIGFGLGP